MYRRVTEGRREEGKKARRQEVIVAFVNKRVTVLFRLRAPRITSGGQPEPVYSDRRVFDGAMQPVRPCELGRVLPQTPDSEMVDGFNSISSPDNRKYKTE